MQGFAQQDSTAQQIPPSLTVIVSLELRPSLSVAVTITWCVTISQIDPDSVIVCWPWVGIRYWNSDAPVPTCVPSTDQIADGPRSPC